MKCLKIRLLLKKIIIEDTIRCNLVVSAGQKLLRNYVDGISYVKTIFLLFYVEAQSLLQLEFQELMLEVCVSG